MLPETLVRKILGKKENGTMPSRVTQSSEGAVAMEYRSEACCKIPIRDGCENLSYSKAHPKRLRKTHFFPCIVEGFQQRHHSHLGNVRLSMQLRFDPRDVL